MTNTANLDRLLDVMRRLRSPDGGCPWDREQTFASLVPHTLEEAFEVADTIERGALDELPGELGDLLFQVVFYAQLGAELGRFTFDDVVSGIVHKLHERHPHVFGTESAADAATVARLWEERKAAGRRTQARGAPPSELDDVPIALPALTRARKLQRRAARVGFDWPDVAGARAKIDEELREVDQALAAGDRAALADELGDLLFATVNVARHLDIDPEGALRAAAAKFERRFRGVEAALLAQGSAIADSDAATLDATWEAVKKAEAKKTGA